MSIKVIRLDSEEELSLKDMMWLEFDTGKAQFHISFTEDGGLKIANLTAVHMTIIVKPKAGNVIEVHAGR